MPDTAIVVLADPFPDEYELYRSTLSQAGFEVVALDTTDAAKAAATVVERRPQAVITRIRPGVFGIELTRHVREHAATKCTPVILITTYTEQSMHATAWAAGADAVFLLPLTPTALIQALRRELRSRERAVPERRAKRSDRRTHQVDRRRIARRPPKT